MTPEDQEVWDLFTPRHASGPICARCSIRRAVCIHEIEPRSMRADWLAPENRITLCHECHAHVTFLASSLASTHLQACRKRTLLMLGRLETPTPLVVE